MQSKSSDISDTHAENYNLFKMESSSNTLELSDQAINSDLFLTLRPLPQDILEMSQEDTACKYCGISYLLLTKYEKMQAEVHKMEQELKDLRAERPGLLSKLEKFLKEKNQSDERLDEVEKNLESSQINLERDLAKISSLENEIKDLNSSITRERVVKKNEFSDLQRKNKLLGNFFQEINLEIIQTKKLQEDRFKKHVLDFEGLISSLKKEWSKKCLDILNQNLFILRNSLESMHANNLGILKNEINDLQLSIDKYKNEIKEINISKSELQDQLYQSNTGFKLQLEKSNSETLKCNSRILELESELNVGYILFTILDSE